LERRKPNILLFHIKGTLAANKLRREANQLIEQISLLLLLEYVLIAGISLSVQYEGISSRPQIPQSANSGKPIAAINQPAMNLMSFLLPVLSSGSPTDINKLHLVILSL
jgi:hypothetical protein